MDQEKIGKFISVCRKEKGLTQASLAEKLGITDRAVSKWETGKSLPDASIMLELCELLEINVNELLTGEHIVMDHYKEVAEANLLELQEQKQKSDKTLLSIEWYLVAVIVPVYVLMVITGSYLANKGNIVLGVVLIVTGLLATLVVGIIGLKIEHDAGFYECPNCGERYVPTMSAVVWSTHYGRTRKMRCPHCGHKGYHKKVLTREKGGI
ncbi:MAG: helix-turn-helix domain-containing protein [Lachnospiraceae bacterium]|nr:helix-turn-helix domain-containing protein [Lachnospiraceae bacterium]